MWAELIQKIKTILQANTLIAEVFDYDVEEFTGDPACTITPSENISDYNTTEENIRLYVFKISVYVKRTPAISGKDPKYEADRKMRNLVDSILNNLDVNYTLTGMTVPTGYTFINLFAVPSAWGYAGREDEYRAAEIRVTARVSVSLNQIS